MNINPDTGSVITLPEAIAYVSAFRKKYPNQTKAFFVGSNKLSMITSHRIYNGLDQTSGMMNQVLIGVDTTGEDMTAGIILENWLPAHQSAACTVH